MTKKYTPLLDFLDQLKLANVKIDAVENNQLRVRKYDGMLSDELKSEILLRKGEIIDFLKGNQESDFRQNNISSYSLKGPYPASYSQKRIWILHQLDDKHISSNEFDIIEFNEFLDLKCLKAAFHLLIERHEILRTVIHFRGDELMQEVLDNSQTRVVYENISDTADETIIGNRIKSEVTRPFDLEKGPLLRMLLLQVSDNRYIFVLTMHHIICDAWSMEVIKKDLQKLYEACRLGFENPLLPLHIQYKDYSIWQNEIVNSNRSSHHANYWRKKFAGDLPTLLLPNDFPKVDVKNNEGAECKEFLDFKYLKNLHTLRKDTNSSMFSILLACFKVILHRFTNQKDILVGVLVEGREQEGLKDLVGVFINTVYLRSKIQWGILFSEFLSKVTEILAEALDHQMYPVEKVLDDLNLNRQALTSPVFFNYLELERPAPDYSTDQKWFSKSQFPQNFDLEFRIIKYQDTMEVKAIYKKELFLPGTINYLLTEFKSLLTQIIGNCSLTIDQYEVFKWKKNQSGVPTVPNYKLNNSCNGILQYFDEVAKRIPDKIAVSNFDELITYKELSSRANVLGSSIQRFHSPENEFILLLFPQSIDMIVSMLGVLASGYAYVPLNPDDPEIRHLKIIEDLCSTILITNNSCLHRANKLSGYRNHISVINISVASDIGLDEKIEGNSQSNLSYVLYTSGSTGWPKGVLQHQQNVLYFIRTYCKQLSIVPDDRLSLIPYYTFDAAVMDIYASLFSGASLHLYDIKRVGLRQFSSWLRDENISVLHLVPTIFRQFTKELNKGEIIHNVRILVFGGESVTREDFLLYHRFFSKDCILINGLGPTESTVTLQFICNKNYHPPKNIPVGFPVPGTDVFVMTDKKNIAKVYEVGEIVYSSDHLSPGYLNQPEQTHATYPVLSIEGINRRCYKSGDLGRWLPSGQIEFLGRKDGQVKVRGIRIETREIELVLGEHINISELRVVKQKVANVQELVVYYTKSGEVSGDELKKHLLTKLPSYMAPAFFVELEHFPMNSNGKIDLRALPLPNPKIKSEAEPLKHFTDTEIKLAGIWRKILDCQNIDKIDSFFEIGGQSLKAMQLISHVHREFYAKLDYKMLFLNSTLQEMADLVDKSRNSIYEAIPLSGDKPYYELSFAQMRMWVLYQLKDEAHAYHLPGAFRIIGTLFVSILERSVRYILKRHQSLHTCFVSEDGHPKQVIADTIDFKIEFLNWSQEKNFNKKVIAFAQTEAREPFDLVKGPLLRLKIIQKSDNEHILLLTMHHIICDAWSFRIFLREVVEVYKALRDKQQICLSPLPIQYKDFAEWQRSILSEDRLKQLRNYWINVFSDGLSEMRLPLDFPRPRIRSTCRGDISATLDQTKSQRLQTFAIQHTTTLFNILLTAFAIVLGKFTRSADCVFATPVAGRNHKDIEDLIGIFINIIVLKVKISEENSFVQQHHMIQSLVNESLEYQDYPFDYLVNDLKIKREVNKSVLYNVGITLQELPELPDEESLNFSIEPYPITHDNLQTDILLAGRNDTNGFHLTMSYNSKLFKSSTITALLDDIKLILSKVADSGDFNNNDLHSNPVNESIDQSIPDFNF